MIQRRVAWRSRTCVLSLALVTSLSAIFLHTGLYGDFMRLMRTRRPVSKLLSRPLIRSVEIDRLSIDSPIQLHLPQNCYHAADLQGNNHTLCSNQVLVGVMSSRRTLARYADGPYLEWTKYKENMIVNFYTPSKVLQVQEAISVDCAEREDNQIVEFSLATFKKMYSDYPSMKWYLKFDDDALLFPTNFLSRLAALNPSKPVIGGHLINVTINEKRIELFSGGAGYFLSNSAMKMLVGHSDECLNRHVSNISNGGPEDVIVTRCIRHLFGDQLAQVHIQEMYPLSYEETMENVNGFSPDFVRPYPVSFHWIKSHQMTMQLMSRTVFIAD
jgi:hypothetical protein